jgi:hypothetical protein
MKLLTSCGRLLKLSFYLALGGASAFSSACGSTHHTVGDADSDSGVHDAAPDATIDADVRPEADVEEDSTDADLWDVPYE